jgi:outer membrane protein assembly factor BamB
MRAPRLTFSLASLVLPSILVTTLSCKSATVLGEGTPWQPAWTQEHLESAPPIAVIHQDSCFVSGDNTVVELALKDGRRLNMADSIFAFSDADGKLLWKRSLKLERTGRPVQSGDELMVVSNENALAPILLGLSVNTGELKWQYAFAARSEPAVGPPIRICNLLAGSANYLIYLDDLNMCALKRRGG